jgi:hypothetical protein
VTLTLDALAREVNIDPMHPVLVRERGSDPSWCERSIAANPSPGSPRSTTSIETSTRERARKFAQSRPARSDANHLNFCGCGQNMSGGQSLIPMVAQVEQRLGTLPEALIVDGGHAKHEDIARVTAGGIKPIVSPSRSPEGTTGASMNCARRSSHGVDR